MLALAVALAYASVIATPCPEAEAGNHHAAHAGHHHDDVPNASEQLRAPCPCGCSAQTDAATPPVKGSQGPVGAKPSHPAPIGWTAVFQLDASPPAAPAAPPDQVPIQRTESEYG